MLKIIAIEYLGKDMVSINENNTIDEVSSSINKVGRVKFKNIVMSDFLAKSKLLVDISSGLGLLTSKNK